ncbi:MAG: YccF domain-containing protein [Beutenbergiaceae bacterium]
MRLLLNVIWAVFAGFWLFVGYVLAGIAMLIPIITIPFAIASFRMAGFLIWPFGRAVVPSRSAGVITAVANVLWFLLVGWELVLLHLVTGLLLAITIIGIPLAIPNVRLAMVAINPLGKEITSSADPRALGSW